MLIIDVTSLTESARCYFVSTFSHSPPLSKSESCGAHLFRTEYWAGLLRKISIRCKYCSGGKGLGESTSPQIVHASLVLNINSKLIVISESLDVERQGLQFLMELFSRLLLLTATFQASTALCAG